MTSAVVRVLLALVLMLPWWPQSVAEAHPIMCVATDPRPCSIEKAESEANNTANHTAHCDALIAGDTFKPGSLTIENDTSGMRFIAKFACQTPTGTLRQYASESHYHNGLSQCSASDPPQSGGYIKVADVQVFEMCKDGCSYIDNDGTVTWWEIDGQKYVSVDGWIPEGLACTAGTPDSEIDPTKPSDRDGDGVSDGNDGFPDDPTEQKDSDGDGVGDNRDPTPKGDPPPDPKPCDATVSDCDGDGNAGEGDGSGDGAGEGSAGGGGTCDAPPMCSGDPILCNVLYQQWQTRCAVAGLDKVATAGAINNCSVPFTVSGNGANALKLRALRKAACPHEGENAPDPSKYLGEDDPTAKDGLFEEGTEHGADGLDDSGMGWSRSCPTVPTVSVFGRSISFDTGVFCDWMHLGGVFVLIIAGVVCLRIVGAA